MKHDYNLTIQLDGFFIDIGYKVDRKGFLMTIYIELNHVYVWYVLPR